jgi:hypothetical protein
MPPRVKLYIYRDAKPHAHDSDPGYENTVPLSQQGIKDHCDVVQDPEEADYFYMGQFSDGSKLEDLGQEKFTYLERWPERHVADIEGDWMNRKVPEHLRNCWLTINGAPLEMTDWPRLVIRPTFSKLFLHLVKNPPKFLAPNNRRFVFKGFTDPWGLRARLAYVLKTSNLDYDYQLTAKWNGYNDPANSVAKSYTNMMESGCFALCPRGSGHDSVRFFEACSFGRIPVIVGDNIIMGEESKRGDTCFFRIPQKQSFKEMRQKLEELARMTDDEVSNHARFAYLYFQNVILKYFRDPTAYLLERLCPP